MKIFLPRKANRQSSIANQAGSFLTNSAPPISMSPVAHAARLRILNRHDDSNRKRIFSLQLTAFIFLPLSPQHKNRPIICMDRFLCWNQRVPVVLSRVSARWRASLARSISISLLLDASLSSARFFAAWARAISMVSASSARGATIFT